MSYEEKVKFLYNFMCFWHFFADKSMRFIHQKHAFLSINSMLLSDKSIEFIFRKSNKFRNLLIINILQKRSFSHYFQQKTFSWILAQRKC